MLRALAALLVAANLLFFAWAQGWLAPVAPPPEHGQREPQRLAVQVNADAVRVLTPQAASAAQASIACVEAGPFADADIGSAEQALGEAGVAPEAWRRRELQQPTVWLVYIGRLDGAAALRTRADALQRLRVPYQTLQSPPELAPGLQLSRHERRDEAEHALARAAERGVRGARVVALPPPPLQHFLRVPRAEAETQARLAALELPGGLRFQRCR